MPSLSESAAAFVATGLSSATSLVIVVLSDGRASEAGFDLLKIQMNVASRIKRTLAVITDRFGRARNFQGTNIAAYYDAGVNCICTRMLSRIVHVNHSGTRGWYAAIKCG